MVLNHTFVLCCQKTKSDLTCFHSHLGHLACVSSALDF